MDVSELLKQAFAAVQDAKLPDDLRVVAFERAIDLLVDAGPAAAAPPRSTGRTQDSRREPGGSSSHKKLGAIGQELGVPVDQVERLFDEHDGELQFVGDLVRLGNSKAAKVADIAVIYMVARQCGKYDEGPTQAPVLRSEIDRHGLLDGTNYSKHVQPLRGYFNINGTGKAATYKMKYEGRQRAKELAKALLAD